MLHIIKSETETKRFVLKIVYETFSTKSFKAV